MNPRRRRPRWFDLGLAAFVAFLPSPIRAQNLPPGYEAGLFELHANTLVSTAGLVVVGPDGRVLVPLERLLRLTGTPADTLRPGHRLRIPGVGGADSSTLDLDAGTVARGRDTLRLTALDRVQVGAEAFLVLPAAERLLGAKATVDWAGLVIAFARAAPFPAEERAEIERRRALVTMLQARAPALPPPPVAPRTGGGVLEWSLSSGAVDPTQRTDIYANVGLGLLGGQFQAGRSLDVGSAYASPTWGPARISYERVFPGGSWLQRVGAGDILSEGAVARSLRGVLLTNAPLRRDLFSAVPIQPDLPRGWEYEVYQEGQLLGVSRAGTDAAVTVPVQYGRTPLEVRMYGPAGEQLTSHYLFVIPLSQLTPGRLEYSAAFGRCPASDCQEYGYGELRYGLASALTVGGGVESSRDTTGRRLLPSARLSLALPGGWSGEMNALAENFLRGSFSYNGRGALTAYLNGGLYAGAFQRGSFLGTGTTGGHWELLPSIVFQQERLAATLSGPSSREPDLVRVRASRILGHALAELTYERNPVDPSARVGLHATLFNLGGARSLTLGGGLEQNLAGGLAAATSEASLSVHRASYLSAAAQWTRAAGAVFSLSYQAILGFGRVQARYASGPVTTASYGASGGIGFDPRAGFATFPRGGIGYAGVGGRVFYDNDADGRFSTGDRPAAGIDVMVGSIRAHTNGDGYYATWEVLPYYPVRVSVDTLSGMEPEWASARTAAVVAPVPHLINPLDFPLVQTRELAGKIIAGAGVVAASGVTVELRNVATDERLSTLTFSDGEYYVSRVRPGTYEISVARSSLDALSARAEPERVTVRVDTSNPSPLVEPPPITLVKR